jgi:lambda family phage portal protein
MTQSYHILVGAAGVAEPLPRGNPAELQRVKRHAPDPDGKPLQGRRFESAESNRLNQAHWSRAYGRPINEDLAEHLETIRTRATYEAGNNTTIEGVINTHVTDVVGRTGPILQITSSDDDYNAWAEAVWRAWWKRPCVNRKTSGVERLRQWVRNMWLCGEFFDQLVTRTDYPGQIKLRLLPVHPRRVGTPATSAADPNVVLGVKFTDDGDPLGYFVQTFTRYGVYELLGTEYREIAARDMLHGFSAVEEDQARGVPWLNSSLPQAARARDYDEAVLDAAENAAQQSLWFYTRHPDAQYLALNETAALEKGNTVSTAPPGYEPYQLQPTQPSAQYTEYRCERQRDIGRPRGMPLMMVRLDSSRHNYSSARFDGQSYARQLLAFQGWLEDVGLNTLVDLVLREAELAEGRQRPADFLALWTWPALPHVDRLKEANADRTDMLNRTRSWSQIVTANGDDPDEVFARHVADEKRFREVGLPLPPSLSDDAKLLDPQEPDEPLPPAEPAAAPPAKNGRVFHVV